jgi:hypothetical protein
VRRPLPDWAYVRAELARRDHQVTLVLLWQMGWTRPALKRHDEGAPIFLILLLDRGACMKQVAMIGIDLAKQVFQIHGTDQHGQPCVRRQLRRSQLLPWLAQQPPCIMAMEACHGAHHWARRLAEMGHDVRLIPPQHVKAFVQGQKNDRNDAAAICEAASRPGTRVVAIKSMNNSRSSASIGSVSCWSNSGRA